MRSTTLSKKIFSISEVICFGLVFLGLYIASRDDYLLFHNLAELFGIIVACAIFVVTWNARQFLDNNYLLFVGIAYLFIAVPDKSRLIFRLSCIQVGRAAARQAETGSDVPYNHGGGAENERNERF